MGGGFIMGMGREIAIVCLAISLAGLISTAEAASLNVSHGEVLLSRGAGYETVKGPAELLVGDTVLGKPGSAAQIAFADGCTVPLGVGTVFKVGTTSPCQPHSAGPGASGVTETPGDSGVETPGDEAAKATYTALRARCCCYRRHRRGGASDDGPWPWPP